MPTMRISESVTVDGNTVGGAQQNYTDNGRKSYDMTIADGQTDQQANIDFKLAGLKVWYAISDQNVTLETNSGTSPQETINLKQNNPMLWKHDGYYPNPFSGDVTSIFITNASGAAAHVQIEVLENVT